MSIHDTAVKELEKAGGKRIEGIRLSIGALSGVVVESLRFALDMLKKDSILAYAEINIDEVPARMQCLHCGHEFEADDFYITCPKCAQYGHKVLSGRDMYIKAITFI